MLELNTLLCVFWFSLDEYLMVGVYGYVLFFIHQAHHTQIHSLQIGAKHGGGERQNNHDNCKTMGPPDMGPGGGTAIIFVQRCAAGVYLTIPLPTEIWGAKKTFAYGSLLQTLVYGDLGKNVPIWGIS